MNALDTNPFRDPARQRELSMRVWNDPKKKAMVLSKRKPKPGFKGKPFMWQGKTKTEAQKAKYREFSLTKKELAELSSELNIDIDIVRLTKEEATRLLESFKKLPH